MKAINEIKSSWAVVTGASSGIGASYAKLLAALGFNVVLIARRLNKLKELAKDLQDKYGILTDCISADLTTRVGCQEAFEYSIANGRKIHIFINNAGCGFYGPFHSYSLDQHMRVIELNISAYTHLLHTYSSHMLSHGGPSYIANVASTAAYLNVPLYGVYAGSKKFLLNLSEALQYEFKNTNLHICCVCPGGTYTEFIKLASQELKEAAHPFMMQPDDVVKIALHAMFKKKRCVVPGKINYLLTIFAKFLPTKWALTLAHLAMTSSVRVKRDYRPLA